MTATSIRYFAATDASPLGELAWAFMRRMIRILPVRVASMTGGMAGRWIGYESLAMTIVPPGAFINVVCCDPSRWTWTTRIEAPTQQQSAAEIAAGGAFGAEAINSRAELWTAGVRNVLIAGSAPRSTPEVDTAKKYDCIVAPSIDVAAQLARANLRSWCISHPYSEDVVRNAILCYQYAPEEP